jgi:hypothetical protein
VAYRDPAGRTQEIAVRLDVPTDGGPTTASQPLEGCAGGCVVTGLTLSRDRHDRPLPWLVTGLDFGGHDALAGDWRPAGQQTLQGIRPTEIVEVAEGLLYPVTDRSLQTFPAVQGPGLPVLASDSATWPDGPPLVDSPGGDERPAEVVGRFPALPLVEADGLLADLPAAAAGAPPTVPAAQVMVLARDDTPGQVLDRLAAETGHRPQTLAQVRKDTVAASGAVQSRVYLLIAGFCLAAALLVLAAAVARQRSAWLRDTAALRVLGVRAGQVRRAGLVEVAALAVAAVVATVSGALAAVDLLLPHLDLVTVPGHAVPLEPGVAVAPLVLAGIVVAVIVLVVSGRGRGAQPASSRPAILREEAAP